jgi:hypothetical protein
MPPPSLSDTNLFGLVTTPSTGSALGERWAVPGTGQSARALHTPKPAKTDSEKTILRSFITKIYNESYWQIDKSLCIICDKDIGERFFLLGCGKSL